VFFLVAMVLGVAVGALACLPAPQADLRKWVISIAIGLSGSFVGWTASVLLGVDQVGPIAQLFVAFVAAGALVSVYQAWTSEPTPLH
jgi:uncharacterized membrane protein YeaQ/YmgE (transglycosylase-associated protein family)